MKKVFQFIMLFAMAMAFTGCGGSSNNEIQNVDEFLSKVGFREYDEVEKYARSAIAREDYAAAHKCIEYLKAEGWRSLTLEVDAYGEEVKYLLSNDPDNAMPRIKLLLVDLTPSKAKPAVGITGYDASKECEYYKSQAEAYNSLVSKIVDVLLALDMTDDAKMFLDKGLEIPVWTGGEMGGQLSGYDNADAQAIANKVKKDINNEE